MKLAMVVCITACITLAMGCSKAEDQPKSATKTDTQQQESLAAETVAAKSEAVVRETPATQSPASAVATGTQPQATAPSNQGTVKSTLQAGGYTYVEAEQNGKIIWIAGNVTTVNPGDVIHWDIGSMMQNFHSKTLNRTFPEILFVSAILPGEALPPPPSMTAKVVSTTQASGYDYLEVDRGDGQPPIWLAAPGSSVKAGDQVTWSGGNAMQNFFSKGLNRNFDVIYFVSGVSVVQ